jgi:uracil-DNA glycosylase
MTTVEFINEKFNWKTLSLSKYTQDHTPTGWLELFEILESILEEMSPKIQKHAKKYIVYPSMTNVYRAFYMCPHDKVKVCILGQDVYHDGAAHGLAFSIIRGRNYINSSLKNIFQKLKQEGYKTNVTGDLSPWAKRGVLLLNTALTVNAGNANSHKDIWTDFTSTVINYIDTYCNDGIVWILWGKQAQNYERMIDIHKHHVIKGAHPSGLSAHQYGFFDQEYFKRANDYLKKSGKTPIDWNLK